MIERTKLAQIVELVDTFPAVAILGPRQAGKTTLALAIAASRPAHYLDLQSEEDQAKLTEPALYLREYENQLVILDEIHRAPEIFATLRSLIDQGRRAGRRAGRFVILGSASINLLQQSSESLAGRIAYVELSPFNLLEVGENPQAAAVSTEILNRLWLRGGFPDSYLAGSDRASLAWRRDFIRTYLQRDIPALGPRIAEETLRRFWTMLAHLHGGLLNAAELSRSLGVDSKTVANYLDLLVDLLLIRRLPPWHANTRKRLVKSPKIYVRDTGVMHTLLHIDSFDALMGHPKLGNSWEGLVVENLLAVAPPGASAHFYRTQAGAEIDLVLQFEDQRWAIEIKRTSAPKLTKGFHLACAEIAPTQKLVVYAGSETYPLGNDSEALPLAALMSRLRGA